LREFSTVSYFACCTAFSGAATASTTSPSPTHYPDLPAFPSPAEELIAAIGLET
jgi:hypothetical protein